MLLSKRVHYLCRSILLLGLIIAIHHSVILAQISRPISTSFAQLPLYFEPNSGQFDDGVKFIGQGSGAQLSLANTSAQWRFADQAGSSLRLALLNANQSATMVGLDQLAGVSNYCVGKSSNWRQGVPHYRRVRVSNLYAGIDLDYYGNEKNLEYDFIIAPNANSAVIAISFPDADRLTIDAQGNLLININNQQIIQHRPIVYQTGANGREQIAAAYILTADHTVGFQLGEYDHDKELIIDPVISYSTYLGGNGNDTAYAVTTDATGNIYLTGNTASTNFPSASGSLPGSNVFVTKINAAGTQVLYTTLLGGNREEDGLGIVVDSSGNAFITGRTTSSDFPTTPGAFRTTTTNNYFQNYDGFVAKLSATGAMQFSTLLPGVNNEEAHGLALDGAGNIFVVGFTSSPDFPVTANAYQPTRKGYSYDIFLCKLSGNGSSLLYSTFLGGTFDQQALALAVDPAGNVYITGWTNSDNFPVTTGVLLPFAFPGTNGFVSKFSNNGALIYSTYLGGINITATSLAVDSDGNAFIAGQATSDLFYTTSGAYQRTRGGGDSDIVLVKLNATGTALIYATWLGGNSIDNCYGLTIDGDGNAYLVGETYSTNFPITAGPTHLDGTKDGFITKVDRQGASLIYCYLLRGSARDDSARAVALDRDGNAYVVGYTFASDFVTVSPLQTAQTNNGANCDAFITRVSSQAGSFQFSAASYRVSESSLSVSVTINRTGSADGDATVDFATADGSALNPTDYTGFSSTLRFSNGETSKQVTIPITNNTRAECGKSFQVKLTNPTAAATLGAQSTAIVKIDEDDLP